MEQVYEIMKKQFVKKETEQLKLRPYKPCDAKTIVSWIKDERALRKWSSDRYGAYPITADDINHKYVECNGDCGEPDNFYPMTAVDEEGIVGHLILRYTDEEQKVIRIGFVIVDDSKRGMGYGKKMLQLAIRYAFEMLKAEKVTLGVFENNPSAYYCYKAAGFREIKTEQDFIFEILGEKWKCIELEVKSMEKTKVAFICVHNSCRSQIAEALGKKYLSDICDCYSAGTETKPRINQDAVRIMKELYGIDMEKEQYSKLLSDIPSPDLAISMGCNVGCPFIGRDFDDNWGLEDPTGKPDEEFKIVIKEIEERIFQLREQLNNV